MAIININNNSFKVLVEKGSARIPIEGEMSVVLDEGEEMCISLSLPTYIIGSTLWATIGHNNFGEPAGFASAYVQRVPHQGEPEASKEREIFNVTLTSSKKCDILFKPPVNSVTIRANAVYYTIHTLDPSNGSGRRIRLAVRFGYKQRTLNLRAAANNITASSMCSLGPLSIVRVLDTECAICMGPLNEWRRLTMACYHTFCTACIILWMSRSRTCPTCRGPLPSYGFVYRKLMALQN